MKSCALVLNNDFILYIWLCQISSSFNQAPSIVLISGIQLSLDCLMTRESTSWRPSFQFFSSSFPHQCFHRRKCVRLPWFLTAAENPLSYGSHCCWRRWRKRRRKKIARRRWLNNSRWRFDEKSVRSTLLVAGWARPLRCSWRWLGMGCHDCQVSKTSTTAKINILNFFLTPQTSSPSLQTMFPHRLHIRQKQIFCSFICNLTLDGIAYTFGVFLVPLMEYFELKEKGPISMIGNNNYTMEMCTCKTIQIGI